MKRTIIRMVECDIALTYDGNAHGRERGEPYPKSPRNEEVEEG
jgi:hypothetical protein